MEMMFFENASNTAQIFRNKHGVNLPNKQAVKNP